MATSQSSEKTTLRGKKKGSNPVDTKRKSHSSVDPTLAQYKNKLKIKDQEFTKARKELQQRAAEIEVINSVQEGLASKLDMQGIYELIGKKVRDLFRVEVMDIVNYDPETGLISMPYSFEKGDRSVIEPRKPYGFRQQVIKSGKPLLINRDFEALAIRYDNPLLTGTWPKSALFVPLVVDGRVKSIISIQDLDREDAYSASDVLLLQTLAHSMGIALENARLFTETQQRNAELAIINSVQEGLASKLEMQEIYELVGDKIRDIFHNADISIVMHDPATNLLHVPYAFEFGKRFTHEPIPLPTSGLYAHVLRTGKTLVINENVAQAFEKYRGHILSDPTEKSMVGVPLMVGGHAHGVITLKDMERVHAFSESDVRLLETLANSMSIALENARLWEQEKMFRKALQRELEIGREIQAGFLPETLPQVEGWEIAAVLLSAREVAGDFYDVFNLPDGNIGLVIADVCDKGVGAALFMTLFRSLIRAAANLDYYEHTAQLLTFHTTEERLERAILLTNNYIADTHGESGMFATVFFGILDPHTGRFLYINGGHEPPVILHAGRVLQSLYKTGSAVGATINSCFEICEIELQLGDTFFSFTDGVPDCRNPQGDSYGRERLFGIIQQAADSAHRLVNIVTDDLNQYVSSATRFDDITLLAVRREGKAQA